VLLAIGGWYARHRTPARPGLRTRAPAVVSATAPRPHTLSRRKVIQAMAILVALLFSKNVYSASLGSYYTFYLIDKFHLPVETAQLYLFAFLAGIVR
jgi:FSR family fosmidomycin resistance protein-like MFS transporter